MGGNKARIFYAIKNMIGNITGMICDGAKPSCAMKVSSGVSTAMLSALMAMEDKVVTSVEGIIDEDVDKSIANLTAIGSKGMEATDRLVLDIMTGKSGTEGNSGICIPYAARLPSINACQQNSYVVRHNSRD